MRPWTSTNGSWPEQETPVVGSVLVDWSRAIDAATEKLDAIESDRKADADNASLASHPQ
jgi:hypothetical protein